MTSPFSSATQLKAPNYQISNTFVFPRTPPTVINPILSFILLKVLELRRGTRPQPYPNTYRVVPALDKTMRVFDGSQSRC